MSSSKKGTSPSPVPAKPSTPDTFSTQPGDPKAGHLLRWYLTFYRTNRLRISLGVLFTLLQSLALVPVPLIIRKIIDADLPGKDVSGLLLSGAGAFGLYLLHAGLAIGGRTFTLLATKDVTEFLRARLCMQLQQMSLRFYDREKASELHARVVIDTERIDVMGNAIIGSGLASVVMFFVACGLLIALNWKLFLLTLCVLPVFYLMHRWMKPRLRESHRNFREGMEGMSSLVNDLLQSIRLVKSFAREDHEQGKAEEQFRTVTRNALAMTILETVYWHLLGFLTNMAVVGIYVVGGMFMIHGAMTVGEIIAFTGMIGFMIHPINALMGLISQVYAGLASLKPVHALLTHNDPLEINEGKKSVDRLSGSVKFDNVTFLYETTGKHALRNVSLEVRPGETIALVGESGAGKSTLANLILGFYFPDTGRVEIDGVEIRDINLRTLRERIGVVSQENVLLNTSIRENLLYGRMDAKEEEIVQSARDANALEFIEKIPDKFDAVVGDRGVRLSGGQRQRLAIARALLKNPQILILDEATSALDSESEAKIQEALDRLIANRTCFIIAHRLSTVMNADRIFVFKDGSLVEQGRHAELLSLEGEYARLCKRQFRQPTLKHVAQEAENEVTPLPIPSTG